MSLKNKPYPIVDSLIEAFQDWLIHRRAIQEVEDLCANGVSEFSRIARDLGVTPDTLDAFVRKGPHAARELPRLLRELGIDQAGLARTQPQLLLDMQRVCAFCGHKSDCNKDLASHIASEKYEEYCENSQTIAAVKAEL